MFDSFPWPQAPTLPNVRRVAVASRALRAKRRELMIKHGRTFRTLYRTLEKPGANPLREFHEALDAAVRAAYGMGASENVLEFLFDLNLSLAKREQMKSKIQGPGLPPIVTDPSEFISGDCIHLP